MAINHPAPFWAFPTRSALGTVAMPKESESRRPSSWLSRLPPASLHSGWGPSPPQGCPPQRVPQQAPLLSRDMVLHNALYTGDLEKLRELFPPHSTADLLLESRGAEPRWSSHQRALDPNYPFLMGSPSSPEDCTELGGAPLSSLCARLVEKADTVLRQGQGPGQGPIVTRTASGPALEFWQAVLVGDAASVSRLLASPDTGLTPDVVFDTSDPERWRDYRFNIRALRLWSLTYVEELTTPIHVSASRGHDQVLQLLLHRGARPDAAPGGRTALHEACISGQAPCARLLLVAGADPDVPDQDGRRPLHLCQGPGALQCAELLLRFGARVDGRSEEEEETPLHVAARGGSVELAALLLRKGASPDARDAEGRTPLLAACSVPFLPRAEAEAATSRCLHLCRLLLSAGADADAADHDRQRPLHLACRRGHVAVAELLLSRGVSVNAMDYGGHTALHWALQGPAAALPCSPEHVVRALLNHGAVRIWPGALPKVLERWCEFPRIIEVLMNTYSLVKLPGDAVDLIPPEVLQLGNFKFCSELLQKHQDFYSSLFTLVGRPRSLKHLSRHALRSHLAACLSQALPQLPLPPCLLRYLQLDFEDVLY